MEMDALQQMKYGERRHIFALCKSLAHALANEHDLEDTILGTCTYCRQQLAIDYTEGDRLGSSTTLLHNREGIQAKDGDVIGFGWFPRKIAFCGCFFRLIYMTFALCV